MNVHLTCGSSLLGAAGSVGVMPTGGDTVSGGKQPTITANMSTGAVTIVGKVWYCGKWCN